MDIYKNNTETKVLRAYLEAALWSSVDDVGEPLDAEFTIDDIHEDSLIMAMNDIKKFLKMVDIEKLGLYDFMVGHDIWLTRNGHGAGFWDRGYSKEIENILMNAIEEFPEIILYIDDNQKLYFM
jgi:hypothetical protein